jgi:glycerol-3-phosphate acyltransferase PlsX
MRIVVDAMGGDYAPPVVVEGAVAAAREFGAEVILVGREEAVRAELAKHDTSGLALPVVHASQVIEMQEHPARAVKAKPDSSMSVGLRLVKDGQADAFVTAGNTGGALAAALFTLGRISGIKRPALATIFPTMKGFCLLLDVGANTDCKPDWLFQFALMGSLYAERVLGWPNPRVGLVSNGEEETKGNELVQAAHQLLKASALNFVGNVEGKDIAPHLADVIVTDGFTGNVIIKLSEGLGAMMKQIIREEIMRSPVSKLGGLLAQGAFARMGDRTDYSEYGGAPLLGVDGVVIIGHGRSNAKAVKNAVRVAIRAVEQQVVDAIREGVAHEPVEASTPHPEA